MQLPGLDEASSVHKFSTMLNRQDGHLQFYPKPTFNFTPSGIPSLPQLLRSRGSNLGQAKLAIVTGHCLGGRLQEWMENKNSVNFHMFGLGDDAGVRLIVIGDLCNHVGFTDVAVPPRPVAPSQTYI
jgi:hypothetical protein